MRDNLSNLIDTLEEINYKLDNGTNLGYDLHYENNKRSLNILITVNIYGEGDLRRAERFIKNYNSKTHKHKVLFKRKHSRYRGSELICESPIFCIEKVPASLKTIEFKDVVYTLMSLTEEFYNSL